MKKDNKDKVMESRVSFFIYLQSLINSAALPKPSLSGLTTYKSRSSELINLIAILNA